jgi:hypothetical protein
MFHARADVCGRIDVRRAHRFAWHTYTAARMILRLDHERKRVGIAAISHKVIRNLLAEVISAGSVAGIRVECVHKVSDKESSSLAAVLFSTKRSA